MFFIKRDKSLLINLISVIHIPLIAKIGIRIETNLH